MKLLIYDVDHLTSEPCVRLWCKDEHGRTVVVLDYTQEPYFYVEPVEGKLEELKKKIESASYAKGKVLRVEVVERERLGKAKKFLKVVVDTPGNVMDIRDVIKEWPEVKEEYEYMITFYRRYLMDKQIQPMSWVEVEGELLEGHGFKADAVIKARKVKPIEHEADVNFKVMAFDIEMAEEEDGEKIIMISYVTNDGKQGLLTTKEWQGKQDWVEVLANEKLMLKRFLELVNNFNPDFIVGYNSDSFDFLKIRERCQKYGISLEIGREIGKKAKIVRRGRIASTKFVGIVHVDLYDFIYHILGPTLKSEVLSLDAVAQELLGIGKLEVKWQEISKAWKEGNHLQRIAEYCLHDSRLTLMLAEKILPQIFALCRLTGLPPFDVSRLTYSQLDEAYLMRKAVEQGVIIENNPKQEDLQKRRLLPSYTGGFVLEPKRGIHENIIVFDFRSLYPTIIITHNISPDTIDCGHEECKQNRPPGFDHYFCTKRPGFIPRNLREVIEMRVELKKKLKQLSFVLVPYCPYYPFECKLTIDE